MSKRADHGDPHSSGALLQVAKTKVPSAITFELSSLGWKAFQDLSGSVLRQMFGQTVVSFSGAADLGRDWAFEGSWHRRGKERLAGVFAVQCKFRAGGGSFRATGLDEELPKIDRLREAGRCDVYVLMTNQTVSSATDLKLRQKVSSVGVRRVLVLGGQTIDSYLREEPALRALVPRVYGLGDLSEILDARAYAQASALLSSMKERLQKFVVTSPFQRSIDALNREGFVLLLGSPAAGKTMIASALAMAALDQWKLPVAKVDAPDLFRQHWNPLDRHQFFWIDDAFGTTQYQLRLADDWNRVLPEVRAAINGGTRVVMTSRDYIWTQASRDLKLSDLEPLDTSQVVVDVHDLSDVDKQQILYNHLKFGDQSHEFKRQVKPFLPFACQVEPFLPEVARRFGSSRFTTRLVPSRYEVRRFFAHPVEHLKEVVQKLDSDSRAGLALVYMSGGQLDVPVKTTSERRRAAEALGSSHSRAVASLRDMQGSLVSLVKSTADTKLRWEYQHPTIGEAFRAVIEGDPQFVSIYLAGMDPKAILDETCCGDCEIAGAIVIEPDDWSLVVEKLGLLKGAYFAGAREAYLVQRTTCEFLVEYAKAIPDFGFAESRSISGRLAVRIHRCGLLSDELRDDIRSAFEQALLERLDSVAIREGSELFTTAERKDLLERVRLELAPTIDDHVADLDWQYDAELSPESWLHDAALTIEDLRDAFSEIGDKETASVFDAALDSVWELESDLQERFVGDRVEGNDKLEPRPKASQFPATSYSIFADVDE